MFLFNELLCKYLKKLLALATRGEVRKLRGESRAASGNNKAYLRLVIFQSLCLMLSNADKLTLFLMHETSLLFSESLLNSIYALKADSRLG